MSYAPTDSSAYCHADACRRAGISIIPIRRNGSKAAAVAWTPYQSRLPTDAELRQWFDRPDPFGAAAVGGKVSGGLERIDFDVDAEVIYPQWCELVEAEAAGLVSRLCVVITPRPGRHVAYRCVEEPIPGNTKLATDPSLPADRRCLIETRGEGGYCLTPESPAECHETGRLYTYDGTVTLAEVPVISAAERAILIRAARSFDRAAGADQVEPGAAGDALRPGDDFSKRGPDWSEILTGWVVAREFGANRYWRRPGKDGAGWSATTGVCTSKNGVDLFCCFSENAAPFQGASGGKPCSCYSKFAAYALLRHGGDFAAAAKELGRQGYGDQDSKYTATRKPPANQQAAADARRHEGNGRAGGPPWEQPIPLGADYAVPAFPVDVLAPWMAEWVVAEARATQTPPDLAAMLVLTFAAAALAKKFRVKVREGWSEPLNLFSVTSLPPGERKSAVYGDALAPVHAYEAAERERMAPIIAEAASEHRVLEGRVKRLEAQAAKEEDPVEVQRLRLEAKEAARELAAHVVPEDPVVYCDDETPESLGRLLTVHGGRMLQAAAEGTAFEIAKGRYSETAVFDVYLKAHAGDPLRTGRIGRARESVDSPALSVALAVQPDVIRGLATEATMRGRGFLARFLYSLPHSRVGARDVAPSPVPPPVSTCHSDVMLNLWRLPGAADESGRPAPHWLRLSPEADGVMQDFERRLEPLLAPGEELSLLAGWGNKLAGAAARIAGVLHVAAAEGVAEHWSRPVSADTVAAAVRLAEEYLIPHAKAAFGLMGADAKAEKARKVWAVIVRRVAHAAHGADAPPRVSRRDLHNWNRRSFPSAEELDPVIEYLADNYYLRPAGGSGVPGRGHKSPKYDVNPLALSAENEAPCAQRAHCAQPEGPDDE